MACEFCGTIDQHSHLCSKVQQLLLQVDGLKKDREKITEGAIRFVQSTLCPEHHGRVQMQSPGEFIAEHDGKCVLCAYRLIDELREMVHLAVDAGGFSFHEEGCPEDDTCDCPDVKRANAAMGDFKSKRSKTSINLPTSEKRKCEEAHIWVRGGFVPYYGPGSVCKNCGTPWFAK